MGVSTNGILAYGYDLGGGDAEWKINEAGEYDEYEPEWLEEHGWDDKLATALKALGITPKQERPQWLLMSWWG